MLRRKAIEFLQPDVTIEINGRKVKVTNVTSVKTLVRGKTSQDCVRRLPLPPDALNTIFFLQRATRRKFSAKALMLTNACQLLYLIPRLSLSLLSLSPYLQPRHAAIRKSNDMSHY